MLIRDIYNRIFAETKEMEKNDHEISDELSALFKNVDLKEITDEEFTNLMCQACAIGERQGFVSGFRVFAKIMCEALAAKPSLRKNKDYLCMERERKWRKNE